MVSKSVEFSREICNRASSVVRQLVPIQDVAPILNEVFLRFQELEIESIEDNGESVDLQYRIVLDTIVEHWQDLQENRLKAWGLIGEQEVAA